jgi:hypothetical protein
MPAQPIRHEFVDVIPDQIDDGVLYVCVRYATAVHHCGCGCGKEVVTPFTPTDWKVIFDGATVSLHPSIGNWSFPCQSHYWIREDKVVWAPKWSSERIARGRRADQTRKAARLGAGAEIPGGEIQSDAGQARRWPWSWLLGHLRR